MQLRDENEAVILVPRNRKKYEITLKQAMLSHWLQGQILKDKDRKRLRYYFGMFDGDALEEVCKYIKYKDGRKTAPPDKPIELYDIATLTTDRQDGKWIGALPPKIVFEILKIAGILEIPGLIGLTQCRIACWCKNRNPREIAEIFSEQNMFKMPPPQELPFE